jgi:hypothetical protein
VSQILVKFPTVISRENPLSGSRVVACGQTDGQTDRHAEVNRHIFVTRTLLQRREKMEDNTKKMKMAMKKTERRKGEKKTQELIIRR